MPETRAEATKIEAQLIHSMLARLERLERASTPFASLRTGERTGRHRKRAQATRFWVYENWRVKRVRIHQADRGFCNNGKGRMGKVDTRNGRWHSDVFPDRGSALAYAQTFGFHDTGYCDHCLGRPA